MHLNLISLTTHEPYLIIFQKIYGYLALFLVNKLIIGYIGNNGFFFFFKYSQHSTLFHNTVLSLCIKNTCEIKTAHALYQITHSIINEQINKCCQPNLCSVSREKIQFDSQRKQEMKNNSLVFRATITILNVACLMTVHY